MEKNEQMNSGLARYRSAPSSYFSNLISGSGYGGEDDVDQFLNTRVASPETDRFFSRFMSSCGDEESNSPNIGDFGRNSLLNEPAQSQFVAPMKHEPDIFDPQQQMMHHSQSQSDHKPVGSNLGTESPYNVRNSMMESVPQVKMGGIGVSNSNLIRQSSSPAGLLANINVDNGRGNFGACSGPNAEASFSYEGRLQNHLDFPPGPPSVSGVMHHATEIGVKNSLESGSFGESRRNDGGYMTSNFPSSSWDDSTLLSDSFLKDFAENDRNTFSNLNSSENQSGDGGTRTAPVLAHHLSLPTSSLERSAMEKLLQFQDSVPLKIRAKRGCATHPRSIAERVRRTKISERMRKLQELVPNMDKQTNTADMLDLAVDYIKDLQKEVTTLSDIRSKCTCSNNQKS